MVPRVARAAHPDRAPGRHGGAAIGLLLTAFVAGCGSTGPSGSAAAGSVGAGGGSPSGAPAASFPRRSDAPGPSVDPAPAIDPVAVDLDQVVAGLEAPVGLVASPTVAGRTFVLEQDGRILILDRDTLRDRPFLDVSASMIALIPDYDERGLLGLAFHPGFATNGRLFVYRGVPAAASVVDHLNRLAEFRLDPDNPDRVDPTTERVILEFGQPQFNHSGGALGFGPDGFLYLGTGDGGGRGDAEEGHSVQGNAQDLAKLNGKVLRIDVDGPAPYAIPADNPFAGAGGAGRPEVYAWGFRNPWRLSWEPDGARRLLVSDVGYGRYEEIDAVVRRGNYGWRIREGRHCLDVDQPLVATDDCPASGPGGEPLIDPVVQYSHRQVGIAVVGGYVYRGTAVPALRGRYVFADLTKDWTGSKAIPRGSLLVADPVAADGAPWTWARLAVAGRPFLEDFVSGMGEDADGELYVLVRSRLGPEGTTGRVLRIVPGG